MKRWAILTLALVIMSQCLIQAYAATYIRRSSVAQSSSTRRARSPYGNNTDTAAERARTPYGTTVAPTTPRREPMDPNKVRATIKMFQGLDKQLKQADSASKNESSEWLKPDVDNRTRLARAVQKQVAVELELIRKIASEEGAKKTVAAIDGLLLGRETRLGKLIKKMEEERRTTRTTRTTRARTTGRYDTRRRSRTGTQSEVVDDPNTNGTQRTGRRRR